MDLLYHRTKGLRNCGPKKCATSNRDIIANISLSLGRCALFWDCAVIRRGVLAPGINLIPDTVGWIVERYFFVVTGARVPLGHRSRGSGDRGRADGGDGLGSDIPGDVRRTKGLQNSGPIP